MSEDATPLVEALLTIIDAARVYLECAPCGRRGRYNVARDRYRWNEEVERCGRGLSCLRWPRPHARFSAGGGWLTCARRQWSQGGSYADP
jgi:hypothetical protein